MSGGVLPFANAVVPLAPSSGRMEHPVPYGDHEMARSIFPNGAFNGEATHSRCQAITTKRVSTTCERRQCCGCTETLHPHAQWLLPLALKRNGVPEWRDDGHIEIATDMHAWRKSSRKTAAPEPALASVGGGLPVGLPSRRATQQHLSSLCRTTAPLSTTGSRASHTQHSKSQPDANT